MAFGDKEKGKMSLLIGGMGSEPKPEDDTADRKTLAEKAFAKAVRSGTGIGDALEELLDAMGFGEGEGEGDEPMPDGDEEMPA